MNDYSYLCTKVDTRDYTVGGLKLRVNDHHYLEIIDLQSLKANSNCQKP